MQVPVNGFIRAGFTASVKLIQEVYSVFCTVATLNLSSPTLCPPI